MYEQGVRQAEYQVRVCGQPASHESRLREVEQVGPDGREVILFSNDHGNRASWTLYTALGEMFGTFGLHLAKIATDFKLDFEDR